MAITPRTPIQIPTELHAAVMRSCYERNRKISELTAQLLADWVNDSPAGASASPAPVSVTIQPRLPGRPGTKKPEVKRWPIEDVLIGLSIKGQSIPDPVDPMPEEPLKVQLSMEGDFYWAGNELSEHLIMLHTCDKLKQFLSDSAIAFKLMELEGELNTVQVRRLDTAELDCFEPVNALAKKLLALPIYPRERMSKHFLFALYKLAFNVQYVD